MRRGLMRLINETVNVLAFRNKLKIIVRLINETVSIAESFSIEKIIKRIVTESVQVSQSIIKDLRDGLVRVRRSIRINKRGGSASLKGRSKTTKLSRKGSQKVNDRSKNAKVNKRSQDIKGEDT
jgi:hypothetical protein